MHRALCIHYVDYGGNRQDNNAGARMTHSNSSPLRI